MTVTQPHRPAPPAFYLVASPWDFSFGERTGGDQALGDSLDQLRGEVGLTGLALRGGTAASREFRIRQVRPRMYFNDGGLHFEPVQYRGVCRPIPATGSYKSFPAIAQACGRYDLSLRMLLATATMGGLAQYYPEFAARNAFDDASRVSVCLLNPAVQECVAGLVQNIPPQFGVKQVVLTDFRIGWFEAADYRVDWPSPLGEVERAALSVCFCPACATAARDAGVEVDAVRSAVQIFLQRSMTHGTSFGGSVAGFLAEQPALSSYLSMQSQCLSDLLRQMAEYGRAELLVECDDVHVAMDTAFDFSMCAGSIRRIQESDLPIASKSPIRAEISAPAHLLLGSRAESFVAAMAQLSERGYSGVQIDNYASLPDSAFMTLKQAIRFARRSAVL